MLEIRQQKNVVDNPALITPAGVHCERPPLFLEERMYNRVKVFCVFLDSFSTQILKKSAEIRRNTLSKTPSNTQKYPSKNTPSKNPYREIKEGQDSKFREVH